MTKKCTGCGATLQSTNSNNVGYIPAEKYELANYCERCFKITHYNSPIIVPLENINDKLITELNKTAKYTFFLVDFLNINKETINTFKSLKVPKTLVISKIDIIPKSIKENTITKWLKREYQLTDNIIYLSSIKNKNVNTIFDVCQKNNCNEAFIAGFTNAGKSTLINNLSIKNNLTNNVITTSLIPNTTLDFIKIKLNDNLTIIDTPGFTLKNTLYAENEIALIKNSLPKKTIKPVTYQTKDITNIILENRIRINPNSFNSMTFYLSNSIKIERIFNTNNRLTDKNLIEFDIPANSDLVIIGLGFINIKKACHLKIYSNKKDLFEIRNSMFNQII